MADYLPAYERMIINEGGYRLHTVKHDRGGMTYAGIARKRWPDWPGWPMLDDGDDPPADMVRDFYQQTFWHPIKAHAITSQAIAQTLFDFAVNAGQRTAIILAQTVAGTTPDGQIGPKTLAAINAADEALFVARFALAKIARYAAIVTKDRSQAKFLLGWCNRTLREAML
jgi:lysozyme family protein